MQGNDEQKCKIVIDNTRKENSIKFMLLIHGHCIQMKIKETNNFFRERRAIENECYLAWSVAER